MSINQIFERKILDLKNTWGRDTTHIMTEIVVKTNEMEIQQVNIKVGERYYHVASGSLVVQCLTGEIELSVPHQLNRLFPCQVLYLDSNEPYFIQAVSDSIVLKMIVYPSADTVCTPPLKAMDS